MNRRAFLPAVIVQLGMTTLVVSGCMDVSSTGDPTGPVARGEPAIQPLSPAPSTSPSPPPAFPEVSGGVQVFRAPDGLYDWYVSYHGGQLGSRFILDADGTFTLQFASPRFGIFQYRGRYSVAGATMSLDFDADSRWSATADLNGSSMNVRYSIVASLSDFVDGVYTRVP